MTILADEQWLVICPLLVVCQYPDRHQCLSQERTSGTDGWREDAGELTASTDESHICRGNNFNTQRITWPELCQCHLHFWSILFYASETSNEQI